MRRRSEKYVIEGYRYAHWIGLYLSFHLKWVLGPFIHERLQNLKTNEDTFAHVITPLSSLLEKTAKISTGIPESPFRFDLLILSAVELMI